MIMLSSSKNNQTVLRKAERQPVPCPLEQPLLVRRHLAVRGRQALLEDFHILSSKSAKTLDVCSPRTIFRFAFFQARFHLICSPRAISKHAMNTVLGRPLPPPPHCTRVSARTEALGIGRPLVDVPKLVRHASGHDLGSHLERDCRPRAEILVESSKRLCPRKYHISFALRFLQAPIDLCFLQASIGLCFLQAPL